MIYLHSILFVMFIILVIASINKDNISSLAAFNSFLAGINFTFVLVYLSGKL